MHDRLIALNSIPRMFVTMGTGALCWAGLAACVGSVKGDFSNNILEASLIPDDAKVWHLCILFIAVGLCLVAGELVSIVAIAFRGLISRKVSERELLTLLQRNTDDNIGLYLRDKIAVAHLAETLGMSLVLFSLGALLGQYFGNTDQVDGIAVLQGSYTLLLVAVVFSLMAVLILHHALRHVQMQQPSGDA